MYCQHCGQQNPPGNVTCSNCGQPLAAPPVPAAAATTHVPNNLVWAILATLLCCLPTGIVAIVYAAQVTPKAVAGDLAGAQAAAGNAALWSWISFGLGLAFLVVYIALIVLGAVVPEL